MSISVKNTPAKGYLWATLLILLATSLTQGATFFLIFARILPPLPTDFSAGHLILTISVQAFIFTTIALWLQKYLQTSFFTLHLNSKFKYISLLYYLFGLLFVNIMARSIMKLLDIEVKQLEILDKEAIRQNAYTFLTTVALIAPVYEEFVFRGVILKMIFPFTASSKESEEKGKMKALFTKYTRSKYMAIIFSSLLFATIHFDADAAIPIFLLGCYFAWITIQTNSILPSTFLHVTQNFLSGVAFLNEEILNDFALAFPNII